MSSNGRGTLAPSPLTSPSFKSKRKSCARRFERCCCNCIIYFPLVFVYGLTSWAVWVQTCVGLAPSNSIWIGYTSASVGIALYILLNWSYTTAVFTDPGSPLTQTTNAYSVIPSTDEEEEAAVDSQISVVEPDPASLTVKSTGEARYCKKCHSRKPDRAHHCSTCRRCVLKMDHHCPWLATCVGFRNYKPFILFLIYTSLFCWLCFAVSGAWVWNEIVGGKAFAESDRLMPVNNILLAVLAGIIALVLSGFTGWHIYLACTGQTTIESLEKTRYLAPIRTSMQYDRSRNPVSDETTGKSHPSPPNFTSQLREIHANALPGITRPEEGLSPQPSTPPLRQPNPQTNKNSTTQTSTHPNSPAHASLRQNLARSPRPPTSAYAAAEARHEQARYTAYLDELDSSKLPNAFDLGWRRNLTHVFGPKPALWFFPVCNTTGDGWTWEASKKWLARRDELAWEREARGREEAAFARERWETMGPLPGPHRMGADRGVAPAGVERSRRSMDVSSSSDDEDGEEEEEEEEEEEDDDDDIPLSRRAERLQQKQRRRRRRQQQQQQQQQQQRQNWGREGPTSNWNDIPDDILASAADGRGSRAGQMSRGAEHR